MLYEIPNIGDKAMRQGSIKEFGSIIRRIRECRSKRDWSASGTPDDKTCDACPVRWDCGTSRTRYLSRFP